MVRVITSNGKFNITQSLFEAIQKNNNILFEKKDDDTAAFSYVLMNNDKARKRLKDNGISIEEVNKLLDDVFEENSNIGDINSVIDKMIELHNKNEQEKEQESEPTSTNDKVNQDIADEQLEKNSNTSDDVKQDASFEVQEKIEQEEEKVQQKTQEEKKKQEVNRQTSFNTQKINPYVPNVRYKMYQLVNDKELHEQIKETEKISLSIVKRCRDTIQSYLGIWGSNIVATKSKFDNDEEKIPSSEKGKYRSVDKTNLIGKSKNISKFTSASDLGRSAKANLQLGLGGFKFSPYFTNPEKSGKALKYYKSYNHDTEYSKIDDMINMMILYKTKTYERDERDTDDVITKFTNMVNNFLHNTVYRLVVNNDDNYNNIIRAIRSEPAIRDLFNIESSASMQQFNTKEDILAFRNKQDKIIDLVIIATPLFYQGKEIVKQLGNIMKHGDKIKG
mgnify:CR=1 FL=1